MGIRAWALAVGVVVLAACGGGHPSPAPTQPTTTTAPDPTSTPTPPATTPPATPTPNEPPAACAGLVPAAPGPGTALRWPNSTGNGFALCQDPITDGHGDWIGVGVGLKWFNDTFVSAADPTQRAGSWQVQNTTGMGDGFPIAPQPDGYHALRSQDEPGYLQRFDAMGGLVAEDRSIAGRAIQGVPGGGSVVAVVEGWPNPTPVYRIVWLGAGGERRADAVVASDAWIVVSAAGNVLAFAAGEARWYDRSGAPLTAWFSYGFDAQRAWRADAVLGGAALADGSVVVGLGTDRPLRFEAGATSAAAPPDWVTAHAGAAIAAVRGSRANAVASVKSAPAAACEVELELLTPDGQSCGTTTLTAPDPCERVTFGADRTVFTRAQQPGSDCVWHWWTGLLR